MSISRLNPVPYLLTEASLQHYRVATGNSSAQKGLWLNHETAKSQVQVRSRIANIQDEGYFGDNKDVGDHVSELRWKNGRRVYYAEIPEKQVLLLLGGNKNGQERDIRQAKKIFNKHIEKKEGF